jgi:hypothetical protein
MLKGKVQHVERGVPAGRNITRHDAFVKLEFLEDREPFGEEDGA